MRNGLTVRTLAALGALALVISGIFVMMLTTVRDQHRIAVQSRAADQRAAAAVSVEKLMIDAESGLRGLQLTDDRRFLAPYRAARSALPGAIAALRALVGRDDPATGRIEAGTRSYFTGYAEPLLRAWLPAAAGPAALRGGRLEPARPPAPPPGHGAAHPGGRLALQAADPGLRAADRLRSPFALSVAARDRLAIDGKRRMDALRAQFASFVSLQLAESPTSGVAAQDPMRTSTTVAALGLAASVLMIVLVALYQLRAVLAPIRRACAVAQRLAGGDLTARLEERGAAEAGELARSFNRLAASLEHARDELDSQNAERRRGEQYLVAQHRVASALVESSDLGQARTGVLEGLATSLGFEFGITYGLDESTQRLTCNGLWAAAGEEHPQGARAMRDVSLARGEGLAGRCWETGKLEWVAEIATVAWRPQQAADFGMHGAVCLPVTNGSEFLGVLQLVSRERIAPDAALGEMLATIGPQLGQFIARKRAEHEADRLKDEFFALVSHELRTPLTSIIGYLELVHEDEALDEQTRAFVEVVERNAQRLIRLVGDLLFVAQVEAGKLSLDPGAVDLTQLAAESVEAARPRAGELGVELRLDAERVPASSGDSGRIAQALDNLISNALKFTTAGGRVDVSVRARAELALIDVRDTGIGIHAAEQAHLFERFFRATSATERVIPGLGLGLTIVKAIVEGHSGRIDLYSEEGRGTTVRVTLPLSQPGPRMGPDASRPSRPAGIACSNGAV